MVNSHWGDVVEDNAFGTHEFMDLCELLGAEPYVSATSAPAPSAEMGDWVEYLTRADDSPMAALRRANGRDEPWRVPFWGIGNEAWGCGGNLRAEAVRRSGPAVRHLRPQPRRQHCSTGSRPARTTTTWHWTETLMESFDDLFGTPLPRPGAVPGRVAALLHDGRALGGQGHRPPASTTRLLVRDDGRRPAHGVDLLTRHCTRHGPLRPGTARSAWCWTSGAPGGTWRPGTNPGFLYQQNTLRDALVASVHFDVFHATPSALVMANIAQTVNVLQAMILTDPDRARWC